MVRVNNISAKGSITNPTPYGHDYEYEITLNLSDGRVGDKIPLKLEGYIVSGSAPLTSAKNEHLGRFILKSYYGDRELGSTSPTSTPTHRKAETEIILEKDFDSAEIVIRQSGFANHSAANVSFDHTAKIIYEGRSLLETPYTSPAVAPTARVTSVPQLNYEIKFNEGDIVFESAVLFVVAGDEVIPPKSKIRIRGAEPFRFVPENIPVGTRIQGYSFVTTSTHTPVSSGGVYQKMTNPPAGVVTRVSRDEIEIELEGEIPLGYQAYYNLNTTKDSAPLVETVGAEAIYNEGYARKTIEQGSADVVRPNGDIVRTSTNLPTIVLVSRRGSTATFSYKPRIRVTTYHKDEVSGGDLISPKVIFVPQGETYTTTREDIPTHNYVRTEGTPSGTVSGTDPIVVTYYFSKKATDPEPQPQPKPEPAPSKTTEWVDTTGKQLKPMYVGAELQPHGTIAGHVFVETRPTETGVKHTFKPKEITPPPSKPSLPEPTSSTTIHTIKNGNNEPEWGSGDCVWCDCEDLYEVTTTITTTTTKNPIQETHSVNFEPTVQEAIKEKRGFNLIYIMDATGSRSEMVEASLPTIIQWAQSVRDSDINYYFEAYGTDYSTTFGPLNKFKIPGTFTGIYEGTKGDRLGKDKRFGQLIDYMESKFPGIPNLFVYEGDFQDYDKPQGKTTAFFNAETLATLKSRGIIFLGINDHATNRTMQSVGENVYEVSTGTTDNVLSRDFILREFAKEVVVQPETMNAVEIAISDPNQGVDVVNVYVTEPDGNNIALQLTSGKYVGVFNPKTKGTHKLNFTFQGVPENAGKVLVTIDGNTTEFPYKTSITTDTKIDTKRTSCDILLEANRKKLRDFAIMYRDLQTCDLAEEGAKGFYNVWCMLNNVIDQLCYLTELAEKQGFKRDV